MAAQEEEEEEQTQQQQQQQDDDAAAAAAAPPHLLALASSQAFLNHHFKADHDLPRASLLAAQLSAELKSLEPRLAHLQTTILHKVSAWAAHSTLLSSSLESLSQKVHKSSASSVALEEPLDVVCSSPQDLSSLSNFPFRHNTTDVVDELPSLAEEVARIERVKIYAGTALRLEALVGDLEDAVRAISIGTPRIQLTRKVGKSPSSDVALSFKMFNLTLEEIERIIAQANQSWPQWKRLFSAVDVRVDSAVVTLRPSAIADYRSQLTAIGWPPPLSTTAAQEDHGDRKVENPLLQMQGESKSRFEESFLALSVLQMVQARRKARQLAQIQQDDMSRKAIKSEARVEEPLWTIDELVVPIGSRAKHHFQKWSQTPDLIFGLAYRIAQQYVNSVDGVLQPILDRGRLVGYCVRDEWISAIVRMVVGHLRCYSLPSLAENIEEDDSSALWLHMVDLAISFDKRMRSLAVQSAGPLAGKLDVELLQDTELEIQPIAKCISVFAERVDWLELWAQLELNDAERKLRMELSKESAWRSGPRSDFSPDGLNAESDFLHENNKAPSGAEITMLKTWAVISRCRPLPQADQRLTFVRNAGASLVKGYLADLLQRCQEAEAMTALAEESALLKVAACLNAACYCEQKLQDWSEDVFFLDLRLVQILTAKEAQGNLDAQDTEWKLFKENTFSVQGSVFDEEISSLARFRTDWLGKIVSAVQRAFDASCQEYQRNKKRWQDQSILTSGVVDNTDKTEMPFSNMAGFHTSTEIGTVAVDVSVSASLIDALAILEGRLRALKESLTEVIFMDLWRNLASSLDQFFLNAVVLGGAKFSVNGSHQLVRDIEALFQVFKPFCMRPSRFFQTLSDAVLLLTLAQADALNLQKNVMSGSSWKFRELAEDNKLASLKEYGVRQLNPGIAGKILSHRLFPRT